MKEVHAYAFQLKQLIEQTIEEYWHQIWGNQSRTPEEEDYFQKAFHLSVVERLKNGLTAQIVRQVLDETHGEHGIPDDWIEYIVMEYRPKAIQKLLVQMGEEGLVKMLKTLSTIHREDSEQSEDRINKSTESFIPVAQRPQLQRACENSNTRRTVPFAVKRAQNRFYLQGNVSAFIKKSLPQMGFVQDDKKRWYTENPANTEWLTEIQQYLQMLIGIKEKKETTETTQEFERRITEAKKDLILFNIAARMPILHWQPKYIDSSPKEKQQKDAVLEAFQFYQAEGKQGGLTMLLNGVIPENIDEFLSESTKKEIQALAVPAYDRLYNSRRYAELIGRFSQYGAPIDLSNPTLVNYISNNILKEAGEKDENRIDWLRSWYINKFGIASSEKFSNFLLWMEAALKYMLKEKPAFFVEHTNDESVDQFIESVQETYDNLPEAKHEHPTDPETNDVYRFSSKEEQELITEVIRKQFQLGCSVSQATMPVPQGYGDDQFLRFFKIDFIIYADKLAGIVEDDLLGTVPKIEPNTVLVGEYFGWNNRNDEAGASYRHKTEVKQMAYEFLGKIAGFGMMSVYPKSQGDFTTQVRQGLESNSIIYNTNPENLVEQSPDSALNQLKNWYRDMYSKYYGQEPYWSKIINIASRYLDVSSEEARAKPPQEFQYTTLKTAFKAAAVAWQTKQLRETIELGSRHIYSLDNIRNPQTAAKAQEEIKAKTLGIWKAGATIDTYLDALHDEIQKQTAGQPQAVNWQQLAIYLRKLVQKSMMPSLEDAKQVYTQEQVPTRAKRNLNMMERISMIKHLVRLAQIAESLEEENPAAANAIDQSINKSDAPKIPSNQIDALTNTLVNELQKDPTFQVGLQKITENVKAKAEQMNLSEQQVSEEVQRQVDDLLRGIANMS